MHCWLSKVQAQRGMATGGQAGCSWAASKRWVQGAAVCCWFETNKQTTEPYLAMTSGRSKKNVMPLKPSASHCTGGAAGE
jgi:hypothetical protein